MFVWSFGPLGATGQPCWHGQGALARNVPASRCLELCFTFNLFDHPWPYVQHTCRSLDWKCSCPRVRSTNITRTLRFNTGNSSFGLGGVRITCGLLPGGLHMIRTPPSSYTGVWRTEATSSVWAPAWRGPHGCLGARAGIRVSRRCCRSHVPWLQPEPSWEFRRVRQGAVFFLKA